MVIDSSGNTLNRPIITNKPSITGTGSTGSAASTGRQNGIAAGAFDSILKQKLSENNEIKFSKHAELRLQSRNISLTSVQKEKMKEAVSKAESKGVRDSLVLMDNLAFVVNVRNRTVITAANSNELKDNVFTNIDGAVIV
jgi:flagellar operon protein